MNELNRALQLIVADTAPCLSAISDQQRVTANLDGQWSAKQILGHLIDSAANNHQRFVRAQFTPDLDFSGYEQERWVMVQNYQAEDWSVLVQLWQSYNLHLAHVIAQIPDETLKLPRWPHTLDRIAWQPVNSDESTTLAYLIQDYLGHLNDHLLQILTALERA